MTHELNNEAADCGPRSDRKWVLLVVAAFVSLYGIVGGAIAGAIVAFFALIMTNWGGEYEGTIWLAGIVGGALAGYALVLWGRTRPDRLSRPAGASPHRRRGVRRARLAGEGSGLEVTSVAGMGDLCMVAGVLQRGGPPAKGDRFRVIRTGRIGVIAEVTNMENTLSWARDAGASVTVLGGGGSLRSKVAFSTPDLAAEDLQAGDKIAFCPID